MSEFAGKVIFITGASRGIGRAIAGEFASLGATVVGTATSEAGVVAINQQLKELDAKGMGLILDVTDGETISKGFKLVTDNYGPLQILVNNAGITRDNLLMRMSDEEWDQAIDANLTGIFRLCKGCVRGMMKNRWGRIINISSVSGFMGNPGQTNYAAAKAGVVGFSKSLAAEVGSRGITVNVVAPGFIETDMTKAIAPEHVEKLQERIALGRLGQGIEIAKTVAFLASCQWRDVHGIANYLSNKGCQSSRVAANYVAIHCLEFLLTERKKL